MKKLLPLFFLFVFFKSGAQPFDNSWINYSQDYYKVKVWQKGIHRISSQNLMLAGLSTATIDPRKIQVWRNGVEQYVYVQGENDGVFDVNDFIEFYGYPNDGWLDSSLYGSLNAPNWQPTPGYSLFTDTAVYFLTVSSNNGKRVAMATDTLSSPYTPSQYFIKESFYGPEYFLATNPYIYGYNRGANDGSIDFTESEGWGAVFGTYGGAHPITIPVGTDKAYTNGPNTDVSVVMGGVNNKPHNMNFTFAGINFDSTYYSQTLCKFTFNIVTNSLLAPTTSCVLSSGPGDPDYSMFYSLRVRYPHKTDLEGQNSFTLFVPDGQNNKAFLDLSNFNSGGQLPVFWDLSNNRRILMFQNGSNWDVLINNDGSSTPKKCFITSSLNVISPPISKISYNPTNLGKFNDFGSNPVDSAFIIITNKAFWSEATTYAQYRSILAPHRCNTLVTDINELTDQFAYGVAKHPLAIKNFAHFILNNWPTEAQNIFLIGKSYSHFDFRNSPSTFAQCLVPSYGVPTSDVLLTVGIDGSQWEPRIPVGRLSAQHNTDVTDYLHKVSEYEAAQAAPAKWMKEILHFGGGNSLLQQQELAGYLSQYESILEDSLYGGNVTTYLKYNTSPIQINLSDTLQAQIDSGVSIMTFFGHASGAGFDASTDDPENYGNHGRYPFVVANSCFAGDYHTSQVSVSEKFVMTPEKAAIGFLASVGLGSPVYLFEYTRAFFDHASHSDYGAPVGKLMQKAIQDIQVTNQEAEKQVSNEMSLQGDPAIRLNNFAKPDYVIQESQISFNPSEITTDLDSFSIDVTTRNYGRAVPDSFIVKIIHTYPDGNDSVYSFKRGNCFYADHLNVPLKTGGVNGAGLNHITVEIDLPDSVDELNNFTNNVVTTDFFVRSKDLIPIYPADYAIYPNNTVTLKASTANPMAAVANYLFEIDTIDLDIKDMTPGAQSSPMYRFTSVTDSGGVISWTVPNYTLTDSTVYFWRVANDSIQYDTTRFHWQQSSFMYINGKTGWAQSHFHQFKKDYFENIDYNNPARKFDFVNNNKSLRVYTMGAPTGPSEYNEIGYYMNNSPIEYNGCQTWPAVMVAVLDSISLQPWTNCSVNYGQSNIFTPTASCTDPGIGNCRSRAENYFIYNYRAPGAMDSLRAFINRVPSKDYIVMYSWFTDVYSDVNTQFGTGFFDALTSLGFNTALLNDTTPFIYFAQKGNTSLNQQMHGSSPGDTLQLTTLLNSIWNRGSINSVKIGPSTRWESLHWNQHPLELPTHDTVYVNIYGQNVSGVWDTLANGVQYVSGKDTSLTWINASQYPYIKLQSYLRDDSLLTPAQMSYWRIYCDDVPECALNPNKHFNFYSNPLQEGDTLKISMAIDNISDLPMDSLSVKFYLYDANRHKYELAMYKMDSLRVNQTLNAEFRIDSTFGFAGENSLWIEANPFDANYHQIEKHHFNNIAEMKFNIDRDKVNPILDVTFDGIHILNNDIVSGKPQIVVQLHDENKFLALNDTGNFSVYLTPPGALTGQKIDWKEPAYGQLMHFTPGTLPKNSCRIDWNPTFTADGIYTIDVDAKDMSNNESGKYTYRISFEVINRSTITEVLNYPNPFSTSTRFVFTLTGHEVPTGMKIQIMTITGKIVREIMQNELGNIHIGRNITDYAWDGTDEYGDRLANGLYLYRVTTDLHGETIEHRETDIDKYFKRGWGKMYLIK
jgi:hypothetical protein